MKIIFKKTDADSYGNKLHLFSAVFCLFCALLFISQILFAEPDAAQNPYLVERLLTKNGRQIDKVIFPGRPPKFFRAPAAILPEPNPAMGINGLVNVPAFKWSYGCSATSGAMMAGYYDNNGFPNMYAPGGVPAVACPMTNAGWGETVYPGVTCTECPLSATHMGYDGLATRGHVDDYWVDYNDPGPDPWIGNWAEHAYADCTGDFMKTNQSSYGNTDGSTIFFYYPNGSPTTYAALVVEGVANYDGGCGLADFFTSRLYTWTTMYNQYIYGYDPDGPEEMYGPNTLGFTYAQFKAEIDAGRPVLIHVEGHTMLGYGYDDTPTSTIYIHDTWDYSNHTMTWGGSYWGLLHLGVTVIQLTASSKGTVVLDSDSYAAPDTVNVTVQDIDLDVTGGPDNTTVDFESDLTGDVETVTLTETGDSTGIFTGSIDTEIGVANPGDGTLQVEDDDTITVTYIDADDGEGGINVEVTDTARITLVSIPVGLTATAGRNYVFLYWNPVSSAVLAGYNVYRSGSLAGAKTKINTGGLVTNPNRQDLSLSLTTTYYYWVTAVDTYGDETDYSNVAVVTTGVPGESNGNGEDGDGSGSGGGPGSLPGCFIATACYGTPMASEVRALSSFRDEYLLSNSLGRIFVGAYYKISPAIADFISKRPHLKNFVALSLRPFVVFSKILIE